MNLKAPGSVAVLSERRDIGVFLAIMRYPESEMRNPVSGEFSSASIYFTNRGERKSSVAERYEGKRQSRDYFCSEGEEEEISSGKPCNFDHLTADNAASRAPLPQHLLFPARGRCEASSINRECLT